MSRMEAKNSLKQSCAGRALAEAQNVLIRINRHLAAPEKIRNTAFITNVSVSTHNHLSHYHFSYDRIVHQVLKNNTTSPLFFVREGKLIACFILGSHF